MATSAPTLGSGAGALMRRTFTSRIVHAGCFVCHGTDAHWTHAGAQGTAAKHHDATGHATWSDVILSVRYGQEAADPRQVDLEDHLAATSVAPEPGRRPVSATQPVPDAPAVPAADVSAPQGRPSRRAAVRPRGARGRTPETAHA